MKKMKMLLVFLCFLFVPFAFATNHTEITTSVNVSSQTFSNYYEDVGSSSLNLGGGVYYITGGTLTLNSVTFSSNSTNKNAGAICSEYGTININNNVIFSSNSATASGGAIYLDSGSTLNINSQAIFSYNKASTYGGSIYLGANAKAYIASNTEFIYNTVGNSGGAISNSGTLTIYNDVIFNSNKANNGGAITNSGTSVIGNNIIFSSNTAVSGGAIENVGTMTIGSNVRFSSNSTTTSGGSIISTSKASSLTIGDGALFDFNRSKDGGVIYLKNGTVQVGNNAMFLSNTATASGGALATWASGTTNITIGNNAIFSSNTALGTTSLVGGGAIFAEKNSKINIGENAVFNFNTSKNGGAIYNKVGTVILGKNISFSSNTATTYGGAIYNRKDTTINDGGKFISNTATTYGGAIYNYSGILNLVANTCDLEFTGNIANGVSNAIYDYYGTINMYASENADIIFNDRIITSTSKSSTLNINKSTTTLTAIGKIILNEDMSGYTGTVNMYNGVLKLEAKTEENSNVNTNKFFSGNISLQEGTIDLLNNAIDNVNVSNFASTNGKLIFDADLSNKTNDNFTVSNSATGTLNLTGINILAVSTDCGTITLFNNEISPELNVLTMGFYGGYEYNLSTSTTKGVLNYVRGKQESVKGVINSPTPPVKSCSLSEEEICTQDLGQMGGTELTMFGNGYDIVSSSKSGITISLGQTLNIEKGTGEKSFGWKNFFSERGAIVDNSGNTNISSGVIFTSNTANSQGGVFYNTGNINIEGSTFNSNEAGTNGGVIGNETGELSINSVSFNSNKAGTNGGAIFNNQGTSVISSATFNSNIAGNRGGAICNVGTTTIKSATFGSNMSGSQGGAIFNSGLMTLESVSFTSNIVNSSLDNLDVASQGGAIFNSGTLDLVAKNENIEFTGNKVDGVSNAIHDNAGTINLYASENADIIFNDRITSENSNSVLNINKSTTTLTANGKIVLNEDMSGYTGVINLSAGTIQIGEKGAWFGGKTYVENATIDMANSKIQNQNLNKITVNKSLNLLVDVDLKNKQMDTISAMTGGGKGKINIKAINILSDAKENKTDVLFTDSIVLQKQITTVTTASSKLYKYDVVYSTLGYLSFSKGENPPEPPVINPIITESQVASAIGGTITQTVILNQAFANFNNKPGVWIRPYAMQDTIKLNDLEVDNTATGTLAGIDFSVGEKSLLSLYVGYAGSKQKYNDDSDIKINQTGYVVGASGLIEKEKYYLGLTANFNFNKAEADTDYGTDKFDMNMYSIGAKAGYNIGLGKKWILEPNLTLMYGNINTQEYQTTQGAKIDSQSTDNILIDPQIKIKVDLSKGWTPYALAGYVYNAGNKTKLVADDISFKEMQLTGYTEYGVGLNKDFTNSAWSFFLQATGKAGDRTGFDGNIGIKYSFGNKTTDSKKENKVVEEKKVVEDKTVVNKDDTKTNTVKTTESTTKKNNKTQNSSKTKVKSSTGTQTSK